MKLRRIFVLTSILLCTFLSFNPTLQRLANFADYHEENLFNLPQIGGIWPSLITLEQVPEPTIEASASAANRSESRKIVYKLFGLIPVETSEIEVMPQINLLPGGHSIGVSLQTSGVLVVGQAPVMSEDGKKRFPGKEAGIEVGDIIIKINDREVHTDQDVAAAIDLSGQKEGIATVLFKHAGRIAEKAIKPVYCMETGRYRIGLYVRDEVAGVGTLTFVEPESQKYGALGHVINDVDTNQQIELATGKIVESTIYSIEKGKRGHPGEKVGSFVDNSSFAGSIEKNSIAGIFGTMNGQISNPFFSEAIPVAWETEVKEGPAKIYTVIHGDKIEQYEVYIERIMHHRTDSKNMVIRVTDPKLLEQTGGIIQGMSGSPIVQDGKIVGAITHVFVNDSTRGYGVFIQNMLKESGILNEKKAA